jgi:hypothetical protein
MVVDRCHHVAAIAEGAAAQGRLAGRPELLQGGEQADEVAVRVWAASPSNSSRANVDYSHPRPALDPLAQAGSMASTPTLAQVIGQTENALRYLLVGVLVRTGGTGVRGLRARAR